MGKRLSKSLFVKMLEKVGSHRTCLEKQMFGCLTELGYVKYCDYYEQYPFGGRVLDFAFIMQRKPVLRGVDLEVDGIPWHSSPEQRKRDGFRTYKLMKAGWIIERFGEMFNKDEVQLVLDKYGIKPSL
ncbi:MAG: hypothetical protein PHS04_17290 [Tissierellia bacterium]|nr:hypothetical protein [Tissierellia bacterium]